MAKFELEGVGINTIISFCSDKNYKNIIPVIEGGFNFSKYILRDKFENEIENWELEMCKINEFNNELCVIKDAKIN